MKHKLLRGLVAVVLVCCLVVSWSPIRAKAVGVDQFIGVAVDKVGLYAQAGALSTGAAVFSWVLLGLGLIVTTAQAIDLMNRYTEFTGELETSIYYYPDGTWSYGVDLNFVERVHAWLFDREIVSIAGQSLTEGTKITLYNGKEFYVRRGPYNYRRCIYMDRDSNSLRNVELAWWYYKVSDSEYVYNGSISNGQITYVGDFQVRYFINPVYSDSFAAPYLGEFSSDGSKTAEKVFVEYIVRQGEVVDFVAPDGAELGEIALPGTISSPDGWASSPYADWFGNSRPATNPDTDEDITVLPIPFSPSADPETQIGTLTQPDIWQGSIADPMPGTGTVPDGSIAETPWEAFKKWISEGWKSIIQAIPTAESIGQAVGNVIKSIFVPDADFITEKWNDIRSRFEFADSITATGEVLVDILDGLDPEPPVIYIDLGAAEGSYNIGGEVPFVDLRWYARYKPTMDLIISAFLWLAFVWRLILKLPGIISGMPGEFVLMNLPVNLPHLGIGSGQRREELESGRNNRRLGDGH